MAIPNVMQTAVSGMMAAKAGVSTSGHNIANANTEGFSRQRVVTETAKPKGSFGAHGVMGTGTSVARVERINDQYLEKHIRNSSRELSHFEEKDLALKQVEDIFNEMNGDGLNRLISRFFNEFRKLSSEPENEAVRQGVREASQALVNDFRRLRSEVEEVRHHLDSRIEGFTREVNAAAEEIKDLNFKINAAEMSGASANDLQDRRDLLLKKLSTFFEISAHKDNDGKMVVNLKGGGPLVVGPQVESLSVARTPTDDEGKPEGALDLHSSGSARGVITHSIKGGKIGALVEVRDQALSTVLERLDELAISISSSVNEVHSQGFNAHGFKGINFFKPIDIQHRAAEFIDLSDEIKASVNNIASASQPDSPGDNRIALAISTLQNSRLLNEGKASFDDFYNSIVTDVGVLGAKTREGINQQRDIVTQLNKVRDQISGVSIDEETTNLMQFQHTYDASAKVVQIADEMLRTLLDLKR